MEKSADTASEEPTQSAAVTTAAEADKQAADAEQDKPGKLMLSLLCCIQKTDVNIYLGNSFLS